MDTVFLLLDKGTGQVDNWIEARRHGRSRSRASRARLGGGASSNASGSASGRSGLQRTEAQ
eukprot:11282102-Heterocapsa_arctica.AAC.1